MTSKLVLVDADGLLYIAGAIGEKREYECVFETEDGSIYDAVFPYVADIKQHVEETGHTLLEREQIVIPGPKTHSLQVAKLRMQEIRERYGDNMEVYLKGDGTNFRDDIATLHTYKGNRSTIKPYWLPEIREYMILTWGAIPVNGKEADDQIATRAFEASKECIICSPDKDLDQIPGLHWNYSKQVEYDISPEEARVFFWTQVLAGDTADNIKGCWKIGSAGAEAMINTLIYEDGLDDESIWAIVVAEYDISMGLPGCPYAGMPAELVALENARLVWMQNESGRLWTPPGAKPEYLEATLDD